MQLNFDGAAGFTGSVHVLTSGLDCLASVASGSGYATNNDGTGVLILKLSISGSACSKLSQKMGTQRVDYVLERAAMVFDFAGQVNFSNPLSGLKGSWSPFRGACTGQGQF
jgi:hypothetical protein